MSASPVDVDDIEYAVLAEQLGFSHLWFADSQMLWSDCYATMALAAARTERIRIGTGVAVAGTRTGAVTAAAHATINRLAPGRVFCAVGTGNTAMRVMGARPMPIAEFERYIEELRGLLDGGEVDVDFRDHTRPVRHLMPDSGFVSFAPRIPLYVSGFGPRAMAVAVRHGDGLVMSIPPTVDGLERAWSRVDAAAAEAGTVVDRATFLTCTLTTIVVLQPGETIESDRVRAACGAFAIAGLHYVFEQWREAGRPDRRPAFPGWDRYVEMIDRTDPERTPPAHPPGPQLLGARRGVGLRHTGADRRDVHGRFTGRPRSPARRAGRRRTVAGHGAAAAGRQGAGAHRHRQRGDAPTPAVTGAPPTWGSRRILLVQPVI